MNGHGRSKTPLQGCEEHSESGSELLTKDEFAHKTSYTKEVSHASLHIKYLRSTCTTWCGCHRASCVGYRVADMGLKRVGWFWIHKGITH